MNEKKHLSEYIDEEIQKITRSPYYFATKYILVNNDKLYETKLDEKNFNRIYKMKRRNRNENT